MSKDWYQDIVDFHRDVMQDEIPIGPTIPHWRYRDLRIRLIEEETTETIEALYKGNLAGIADGIADSIVVLLGTAVMYGIDLRPIWTLVHNANMEKKGGHKREDGKMMKPEGWQHPDINAELVRQVGVAMSQIVPNCITDK